jgi:FkbM family methyltransferase
MPLLPRLKSIAKQMLYGAAPVWDTPENQRYMGYTPEDVRVFDRFRNVTRQAEPGFLVDYLGVRTRPESLASHVRGLAGTVHGIPVPGDWHAEAIEHIGLLKSVLDAKGTYRVMELGAGWGPWLVAGAAAAKHLGISDIHMLGVEADSGHYASLRQHLLDNGFNPEHHTLLKAAVGATAGKAQFPKVHDSANQWGARPTQANNASDAAYLTSVMGGNPAEMEEVEVLAINDLLAREPRWDLVHIDVQGWEADICQAGMQELGKRVRRVIIGTHSRKLDGDLMAMFHQAGWLLEHEKPTQMKYDRHAEKLESMTWADGTQIWRNQKI